MKKAIIVDIDDTLFMSSNIFDDFKCDTYPEKSREWWDCYHSYYNKTFEPTNLHMMLKCFIEQDIMFLFITSREDRGEVRKKTREHLSTIFNMRTLYTHSLLLMRSNCDYRSDLEVKRDLYEKHVKDYYDVILGIDDRQDICDLWNSYGIPTLKCTIL